MSGVLKTTWLHVSCWEEEQRLGLVMLMTCSIQAEAPNDRAVATLGVLQTGSRSNWEAAVQLS